jgi:hypothetical protein
MWLFRVWFGVVVCITGITGTGLCQVGPQCYPGSHPGHDRFCQPQAPRPVTRSVQVEVPVPCAPQPCMPSPTCAPYPCCPPPCPTKPVQVRVDVVVKPENPKPCVPQRFCCENPPVFEPIFYHAAWMLKSIFTAPLGLGESMLGHGSIRQPCPPPIPIACVPGQVAPCRPPAYGCTPPPVQHCVQGPPSPPVQGRSPYQCAPMAR